MKPVQLDLLHQLWEFLTLNEKEIAPKFNLATWAFPNGAACPTTDKVADAVIHGCGTSACAVGWGVSVLPDWQEVFKLSGRHNHVDLDLKSEPRLSSTWHQLGDALGLWKSEAEYLFLTDYYNQYDPKAGEVAERIEQFINELPAERLR